MFKFVILLFSMCVANADTLPNPNIPPVSDLINGKVLPMQPTLAKEQSLEMSQKIGKMTLFTHRTLRAKGTRAPIHVHPFGGQTCVVSGEMTLYMDGAQPARKVAGECYWMPPVTRMSGVNTGDTDALMFDTFLVDNEDDIWVIVEPNLPFTQKQYNSGYHH
jgi:quercetin dioxygenase-like cupin family protein